MFYYKYSVILFIGPNPFIFFVNIFILKQKYTMPISIKFPFKETQEGGVFLSNKTTIESIQTNLISLLTTKRRHRVMHHNMYSPLWDYIFEPWDDMSSSDLKSEIIEKVEQYIPEVTITDVKFNFIEETNLLEVKIIYRISELGVSDSINVAIPVEPGDGDDH